ncbi:MAG: ImmA/IrrE family metallo-endopeptidase [Bacillota bacterium]
MIESLAVIKAKLLVKSLVPQYPIDIQWLTDQVLHKPSIIHECDMDKGCSAVIVDKPHYAKIHIGVNNQHPKHKQRFGIVHEIAHIYCEHKGNISFIDEEEDPVLRREADSFATEVLMPTYYVLSLSPTNDNPLKLAWALYSRFKVSYEAACRRILELGIYQGLFAMFNRREYFCMHRSPGFSFNNEQLKKYLDVMTPQMEHGEKWAQEVKMHGSSYILYIQRFNTGNYLAFLVAAERNRTHFYNFVLKCIAGIR